MTVLLQGSNFITDLEVRITSPVQTGSNQHWIEEALKTLMVIPRSPEPEPRPELLSSRPMQSIETDGVEDDSLNILYPGEQSIYKMLQSRWFVNLSLFLEIVADVFQTQKHSNKKYTPVANSPPNYDTTQHVVDLTID